MNNKTKLLQKLTRLQEWERDEAAQRSSQIQERVARQQQSIQQARQRQRETIQHCRRQSTTLDPMALAMMPLYSRKISGNDKRLESLNETNRQLQHQANTLNDALTTQQQKLRVLELQQQRQLTKQQQEMLRRLYRECDELALLKGATDE